MSTESNQQKSGPVLPLLLTGRSEAVVGENLTYKQELFCRYYTQNEQTLLNGTLSYAEAYGFDLDSMDREPVYDEEKKILIRESEFSRYEHYCGVAASRLMRNDRISKRINDLFVDLMREDIVDARLMKIIIKGKDNDSLAAIREFNALKQRITKKLDLSTKGESLNVEDRNKLEKSLESII